jgi:hypothetical protein
MLSDALSFPRRGDDWLPTLLIGGVLSVLASFGPLLLFVPFFVLQGYLVRVLDRAARDQRLPPSFTEWGSLVVDGLKAFVVSVVYGLFAFGPLTLVFATLVVIVPTGPTVAEPGMTPEMSPPPRITGGLLVFVGLLLVALVLFVIVGYLLPAALANFAIEGRLGAAFHLRTIGQGAFTKEYAVAWLLAVVVGAVGGLLGSLLSAIVVGIFVLFYVQVSFYYLVGRGFAAGLARKRWSEPAPSASGP